MPLKETIDDIGERAGEIFDSIGEAASSAFDTLSAAASDTVEVQKKKSKINSNKRIIDADYTKIGKVIYERFAEGSFADDELACLFNEITESKVKIRDLQIEIEHIKATRKEAKEAKAEARAEARAEKAEAAARAEAGGAADIKGPIVEVEPEDTAAADATEAAVDAADATDATEAAVDTAAVDATEAAVDAADTTEAASDTDEKAEEPKTEE